ncbi:MAG: hypothetical protein JWP03_377 [Phycisphaerales bacterium]|nr:hypothetical protein [Phycisphaerales bacterium]
MEIRIPNPRNPNQIRMTKSEFGSIGLQFQSLQRTEGGPAVRPLREERSVDCNSRILHSSLFTLHSALCTLH